MLTWVSACDIGSNADRSVCSAGYLTGRFDDPLRARRVPAVLVEDLDVNHLMLVFASTFGLLSCRRQGSTPTRRT